MRIRRCVAISEEILAEGGDLPLFSAHRAGAAAVIENPWLGTDNRADLSREIRQLGPDLGMLLTQYLIDLLGGPDKITSFGKGAIVGLRGEREHGAAFQHTNFFANIVRQRLDGTAVMSATDLRGPAGTLISVPMAHKAIGGLRDYYESMPVWVDGAPEPDELVVIAVASTGPRPNARIGNRSTDPEVNLADYSAHPLFIGQEKA